MKGIINYIKRIPQERLVWCLAIAAFCWTDVADYHHMVNTKKLCIWIALGFYYAYKLGAFKRENRFLSGLSILAGGMVTGFYVTTNFFANYTYYNYTLGLLSMVFFLQYGMLAKQCIRKRRFPQLSITGGLIILMMLFTQFSPHIDKSSFLVMLLIILPYACMEADRERLSHIFHGMVDGICLGFLICQAYTFLFRPYFLTENGVRYKGYTDYCTFGGVTYLQFYIGWLMKYVILLQDKTSKKWQRCFLFIMSAFALSLIYITGGRSPVLGAMGATAILVAWSYRESSWKKGIGLWIGKCALIGVLSLALFPVTYLGTRYLPTIINMPDLQDSEGNRLYSFATKVLKQSYLWDEEWNDWSVKKGEARDSAKYVTFVECVEGTLCRIIPIVGDYAAEILADDVFEANVIRAEYMYEQGLSSELDLCMNVLSYADTYEQEIPEKYIPLMQKNKQEIQAIRKAAQETEMVLPPNLGTGRGESPETGWFPEDYEYSSMELRQAIHLYAVGKLNLFGHARMTFAMFDTQGDTFYIGHPHNAFLIIGYDYGIFAMVFMAGAFILTAWFSWKKAKEEGRAELLLPVVLIIGFTIYGWYESGFGGGNAFSILIMLCAALWRSKPYMKKSGE